MKNTNQNNRKQYVTDVILIMTILSVLAALVVTIVTSRTII